MKFVDPVRHRLVPIALAQAVGLGCGVIGVRLLSDLVSPNTLGAYGVFLTFTTVGVSVIHAGILKFIGRHWAAAENRAQLIRTALGLWRARLPWLLLAALAATVSVGRLTEVNAGLILAVMLVTTALHSLSAFGQSALQATRHHWRDFAVVTTAAVTRTFAPLLFLMLLGSDQGLYLGIGVHAVATAGVAALSLRTTWGPAVGSTGTNGQLAAVYEGPLFTVLALAGWALTGVNRWIVAGFFGETTAGYFTLATSIAVLVPSMLGTIALQYFQPGFFATGDDPEPGARAALARRVDAVAAGCTVLAGLGLAALVVMAPSLVGPLIGERYRAALPWLLPAGCFGIATTIGLFFHSLLLAGRREKACAPVDLTATAILIGGGLVSGAVGESALRTWLLASPLVPWLVNRPLARHYFFQPPTSPAPGPDR